MKKVLSVLVAGTIVLAGGACFAQGAGSAGPVYVKVLAKYVMPSDPEFRMLEIESDNGYGFGGAVGVHFDQFRVEAEVAYQETDIDAFTLSSRTGPGIGIGSGDTKITTYMVNGYYEFPIAQGFGIYVTAGLGMGTTEFELSEFDDDDTNFAWKGGAGVSYTFNRNLAMDLGWEYIGLGDADINHTEITDIYTNNIVAALRYSF